MALALNLCHTPPQSGPELLIVRLRAGRSLTLVILSESPWGTWTHWNGKRSEPCYTPKARCAGCSAGLPRRWKGYLHAWNFERRQQIFVELTPCAMENVTGQVGAGVPLRGQRVTLERMKGDQARLKVHLLPFVGGVEGLPPAKDPEATLRKLWGIDREVFNTESPEMLLELERSA